MTQRELIPDITVSLQAASGPARGALAFHNLVLTRNALHGFGSVNPVGDLGYRQVKERRLGNGLRAFQGEFSLVSALRTIGGARELLASADSGHRDLSGRLMKTAAIQAYLTARGGAFAAAAAK